MDGNGVDSDGSRFISLEVEVVLGCLVMVTDNAVRRRRRNKNEWHAPPVRHIELGASRDSTAPSSCYHLEQ